MLLIKLQQVFAAIVTTTARAGIINITAGIIWNDDLPVDKRKPAE